MEVAWVWRSRWLVALTHGIVVAWSLVAGLTIDWPLVLITLLVSVVSNYVVWANQNVGSPVAAAALLALDLGLLTLLLLGSGSSAHPFTFLYLFQVVVAAMVLESRWVWGLVLLAALGYGSLFVPAWLSPDPHAGHAMHGSGGMFDHYVGMWVAFGVTAPFAAFVVTRVRQALADATAQVEQAQRLKERTERLTALGTLAAGAAHELATPLASIAVIAGDLSRSDHPETADDGATIRQQVERCRAVLNQLAADSGQGVGQRPELVTGRALLERVLEGTDQARLEVTVNAQAAHHPSWVPADRVAQAIRQLVANGLDATDGQVEVNVAVVGGHLQVTVHDAGSGMAPDVLARATEPFFTTKPVGQGTGLGLHFVRSIAEQVGGSLDLASVPGEGTTAIMTLPTRLEEDA
ncbi:MAG: HAMP domain-containing sensor histidine kinase [Myxococcota bacterium]